MFPTSKGYPASIGCKGNVCDLLGAGYTKNYSCTSDKDCPTMSHGVMSTGTCAPNAATYDNCDGTSNCHPPKSAWTAATTGKSMRTASF